MRFFTESVATSGLVLVVLGYKRSEDTVSMVAAWIGAAYWFTASTSFANPEQRSAARKSRILDWMEPIRARLTGTRSPLVSRNSR